MSVPAYPRNTHLNDLIVVSRIYSEIRNTLYTIINTDSENNGDKRKSVFTKSTSRGRMVFSRVLSYTVQDVYCSISTLEDSLRAYT